jgi:putative glycosyltransferase (TIGR04372 family)
MIKKIFSSFEKIFNIIILIPHPTTIGNTAEEIFYGLVNADKKKVKLAIIKAYKIPGLSLCTVNNSLYKINSETISKNILIINICRLITTIYFGIFSILNRIKIINHTFSELHTQPKYGRDELWNPDGYLSFNRVNTEKNKWEDTYKREIQLQLDLKEENNSKKLIKNMGIEDGQWFVCLHVRESGFWNDSGVEEYRNADIRNYIKAIEKIKEYGGITVRMGDPTMTKMPLINGLIDYPFLKEKSAQMDMYLLKNCKLYIGMQSGILDVAILFGRPIIMTNMVSWLFPFPPKFGDRGILKHMYEKHKRNKISLNERMNLGWDANGHRIDTNKYELVENSPDEILEVVEEYFSKENLRLSSIEKNFNKLRQRRGFEIIENEVTITLTEKYRIYSRLSSVLGNLGCNYLRNNF